MIARLLVTTTERCATSHAARAELVADRLGVDFVPRTEHLRPMMAARGATHAYVISTKGEALRDGQTELVIGPGLFHQLSDVGDMHPLARACRPVDGAPIETVVDATLGLGKDAIHLAELLGCTVLGLEASPILFSLVEAGLGRLALDERPWAAAARRVTAVLADSRDWLAGAPAGSADIVYLDPMFESPHKSAPGFGLLRDVALSGPLTPDWIAAATRVARRRVVVRLGKGEGAALTEGWSLVRGKSVDYKYLDVARSE